MWLPRRRTFLGWNHAKPCGIVVLWWQPRSSSTSWCRASTSQRKIGKKEFLKNKIVAFAFLVALPGHILELFSWKISCSHLVAFFIVRASQKEAFLPLPYWIQMAQYGLRFVWYDLSSKAAAPALPLLWQLRMFRVHSSVRASGERLTALIIVDICTISSWNS